MGIISGRTILKVAGSYPKPLTIKLIIIKKAMETTKNETHY
jgi:hypothetical protein